MNPLRVSRITSVRAVLHNSAMRFNSMHSMLKPAFNRLLMHIGFVAAYVALDAASFIHPLHGLNITPWNPAPALGLVFLFRYGHAGRWVLVGTVVLSEWIVRGIPQAWWASLFSALVLAIGYVALGEFLRKHLPPSFLLDDRASLLKWLLPIAGGTFTISLIYLSALRLCGLLPAADWLTAVIQFWVGDGVGIAVAMPLFWWLSSERGRVLLKSAVRQWETLGYVVLSFVLLWVVFHVGGQSGFKLFYLLFFPIVWASARQGMAGAIVSASLLQLEVIATVQLFGYDLVKLAELQMLSLAMALIGFYIGAVVDEQRRTSEELKQTLRLAAAGEMAGALAHELNQPLTALDAYATACRMLMEKKEAGERLNWAISGMLKESERAGHVVRRLRDFFRTGATTLENLSLAELIEQASVDYLEKAGKQGIEFHRLPVPRVVLWADRLQLEVVLRNLLANAFEAAQAGKRRPMTVSLSAASLPGGRVQISVEDSGDGLSSSNAAQLFEPFQSTKSSGLGLGLVISKAIVETHGGTLWGEMADHGVFRIILPAHEPAHD